MKILIEIFIQQQIHYLKLIYKSLWFWFLFSNSQESNLSGNSKANSFWNGFLSLLKIFIWVLIINSKTLLLLIKEWNQISSYRLNILFQIFNDQRDTDYFEAVRKIHMCFLCTSAEIDFHFRNIYQFNQSKYFKYFRSIILLEWRHSCCFAQKSLTLTNWKNDVKMEILSKMMIKLEFWKFRVLVYILI